MIDGALRVFFMKIKWLICASGRGWQKEIVSSPMPSTLEALGKRWLMSGVSGGLQQPSLTVSSPIKY